MNFCLNMENRTYSTLRERIEDIFDVRAEQLKSLTRAGRNTEGEKESFVLPCRGDIEYGIRGQVKQQYLSQGYKFDKEEQNGILWFSKSGNLLAVNITSSDSRIRVSAVKISS